MIRADITRVGITAHGTDADRQANSATPTPKRPTPHRRIPVRRRFVCPAED